MRGAISTARVVEELSELPSPRLLPAERKRYFVRRTSSCWCRHVGALEGWSWASSPRRWRWHTLPPCLSLRAPGARLNVHLCDLMIAKNEHNEVGMRLTIMSRGPGKVVGRCLKPLSASAGCPEHFLMVLERHAENVHLCHRPPVATKAQLCLGVPFRTLSLENRRLS